MNRFSIKDLENLTGIKAHTIRIWEQRYGILTPKRTLTNIRYYEDEDLKTALRVSLLNQFGYKISRISQMTKTDMETLIQKIGDPELRMEAQVNALLEAALNMEIYAFEALLNNHIKREGIQHTMEELVFGFLEKVGTLWMRNKLIPAQEHLASRVIERKLNVALDELPLPTPDQKPSILLFLPEGEIHELGLLYVHYILRLQGYSTYYLGSNSPIADAVTVCREKEPKYVWLHLTALMSAQNFTRFTHKLFTSLPKQQLIISGAIAQRSTSQDAKNIHLVSSLEDAKKLAEDLDGFFQKLPPIKTGRLEKKVKTPSH